MSDRKNILLIATGGTIASKKSDNGLKPQISPEELMQYISEVALQQKAVFISFKFPESRYGGIHISEN